ncbi:MAG: hypothetical protein ACOH5I_03810 [Oligoflexus sp.]
MNSSGLETKYIMPSWWVKAFETVASLPQRISDPFDLSSQMGLIPALNRPELDALGSLIHKIQSQLLAGAQKISIRVSDHVKSSPYTSLQQRFAFDRILQLISASHLAAYGSEGEATTRPLFRGFRIDSHHPRQEWNIQFDVDADNRELVFGFVDPFAELQRICEKRERNLRYCSTQPPLKLWKPVWLELQAYDQTIFLRLEKAMQWEQKLLRLDGAVGEQLADIFRDMSFSKKKSAIVNPSRFAQSLRILRRLGRRLVDHGILLESGEFEYSSLSDSQQGPILSWLLAPHYLADLAANDYEMNVVADFDRRRDWKSLLAIFAGPKEIGRWQGIENLWLEWLAMPRDEFNTQSMDCVVESSFLYSSRPLFLELLIRYASTHPLTLHDEIKDGPYHAIFESGAAPEEKYRSFCEELLRSEDQQRELKRLFSLSLGNQRNQNQPQVLEHLVSSSSLLHSRDHFGHQLPKPNSIRKEVRQQIVEKPPETSPQQDEARSIPRLKQEAAEELAKMRKFDRKKYQKLKESYLETLDPEKKKIIFEVKQRLQPEVFDDHLKQSLVKFMLENPRHWRPSTYA